MILQAGLCCARNRPARGFNVSGRPRQEYRQPFGRFSGQSPDRGAASGKRLGNSIANRNAVGVKNSDTFYSLNSFSVPSSPTIRQQIGVAMLEAHAESGFKGVVSGTSLPKPRTMANTQVQKDDHPRRSK
jgi:hypothetical protein